MVNLAELETKAIAATQGEWSVEPHGSARALYAGRNNERHGLRLLNLDDGDRNIAANAAYIVAAQPSIVLELIERVRAAEAKVAEPVAWILPGDDTAHDDGSIDALIFSQGEFTRPLYAASPDVSALQERVRVLEEALGWYGEQARLCRLITREGDVGRHALDADGGKRAREALGGSNE